MTTEQIPHPAVVSQDEWLEARVALLQKEKELTRAQDRLNAERRRLPMVKVDKNYTFDGPEGKVTLLDLFQGKRQLIVYHFMFGPDWENGCSGCTSYIDAIGDLSELEKREVRFVVVSRAPLAKLEEYKAKRGWNIDWYSSYGSDFNYDYHVTLDESVTTPVYNYRPASGDGGEVPGTSVFFRIGDEIYHTYSTYARGGEYLTHSSTLFDITPYGRQQDWEDSPEGWPQYPTYG